MENNQKIPLVSIYNRKPQKANFSVERLFLDITRALPPEVAYKTVTSTYESRGFFRRLFLSLIHI